MIIPVSTDAPIYYWPWMTLVLIGVNVVVFLATGFGLHEVGWQVSYGQGLHPLEWVTYNFFHYDWFHLIGNLFFLWGFGIVVEGKLGWWKYLLLYLGIGILGGAILQSMMLGFVDPRIKLQEELQKQLQQIPNQQPGQAQPVPQADASQQPVVEPQASSPEQSVVTPQAMSLWQFPEELAEDEDPEIAPGMNDPGNDEAELDDIEFAGGRFFRKPGAGGASLVIYALLAITLVWAPKNEVTCFVLRIPPGTFDIEYMYFCGFRVATQVVYASLYGFQMSSELGHAVGAVSGFAAGTLFLKQKWVDCENWDLFAVWKGTHGSRTSIGGWQENLNCSIATPKDSDSNGKKSKKKKMAFRASIYNADESPKSSSRKSAKTGTKRGKPAEQVDEEFNPEAWDSFDESAEQESDDLEFAEIEESFDEPVAKPKKKPTNAMMTPASNGSSKSKEKLAPKKPADELSPTEKIRSALQAGQAAEAFKLYQRQKQASPNWKLAEAELAALCDGLHKAEQWSDAVPLMEEYLAKFPQSSDRIRLKLAAIYAQVQRRPRAAMKLLAQMSRDKLPEKLQAHYDDVRRLAQKRINAGTPE